MMKFRIPWRWIAWLAPCAAILCMLSFYQTRAAPPRKNRQPFANAVEQRFEIIRQLKQTNALLKEQNALLRGGKPPVAAKPQR